MNYPIKIKTRGGFFFVDSYDSLINVRVEVTKEQLETYVGGRAILFDALDNKLRQEREAGRFDPKQYEFVSEKLDENVFAITRRYVKCGHFHFVIDNELEPAS